MAIEIRVPLLGESVTEATVGQWFKQPGDAVDADEPLLELETDKVTLEVPSPAAGVLADVKVPQGSTVPVGAVLGSIRERDGAAIKSPESAATKLASEPAPQRSVAPPAVPTRLIEPPPAQPHQQSEPAGPMEAAVAKGAMPPSMPPSPSARKLMEETGLTADDVSGTGRRGQILKEDALTAAARARVSPALVEAVARPTSSAGKAVPVPATQMRAPSVPNDAAREERVRMTRLRQTIARRLKDVQNTAAMLTTFNDADMSAIMSMRSHYKDLFEKRHGVKLGFMSFFVKACIRALKEIPAVNAEIDGQDIIFKNYYHIGVAVGTDRGLVVPVVREADRMSLAEIEQAIADFGKRAREGKLTIEEMQGGTFTITNGGVYGSVLSTPILNPPQSGILGMHRIEDRAVVRNGQIVVRPMMNLALSYDHRIVDGKDAVTFLVRVKECLEDPQRFVLEL